LDGDKIEVHYDLEMFANLLRAATGVELPSFLLTGKGGELDNKESRDKVQKSIVKFIKTLFGSDLVDSNYAPLPISKSLISPSPDLN
jgi:hypothetical protein